MTFRGWPEDALHFYAGLETDNSNTYWQAHKAQYDETVKAPFEELSRIVEREFGPLHIFRPNRDIRFSKDKSPYKTAAAAVTESEGGASYYVQVSATGLYAGSGYYHLQNDQLERFRRAVADAKTGPQLARAVDALRKQRYEVDSRDSLKRAPRGFDPEHPRVDLLRMKGIHVGRTFGAPRWLHTKAAADRVTEAWRAAGPVNRWLDRHVGPSTLAPPEPDRP